MGRLQRTRSRRPRRVLSGTGVLGVVPGEQPLLVLLLREEEEDDRGTEQDRDDAGRVRPVRAVEERSLGPGRDLARVLRVLLPAISSAPANDLVSWLSTLSVICCGFGAEAIAAPTADA